MTPDEFRVLLDQSTDLQLLDPCLYDEAAPYVFESEPASLDKFRDALALSLMVARTDIRVVGSARLGFSMKPWQNLRSFQDTSDIDVLVVNQTLFDELWGLLLTAAYPRPPVTDALGGWLRARRNEVYTGWLTPVEIRLDRRIFGERATPVLNLATRWFNALKQASQFPPRRHEDVQGRLYRTWRHAELYHLYSLAELRRSLE